MVALGYGGGALGTRVSASPAVVNRHSNNASFGSQRSILDEAVSRHVHFSHVSLAGPPGPGGHGPGAAGFAAGCDDPAVFELPSVDDLEVAAAAAAAALEVLAPAQMRPVDSSEDSSDDSSSDEDSDSDEDTGDSAEDSSEEGGDAPPGGRTKEGVSLQLQVDDASGRVAVRLVASEEAGDVEMREAETDSSPLTSSSSSDDEEEAAAATSRMVDDEELEVRR